MRHTELSFPALCTRTYHSIYARNYKQYFELAWILYLSLYMLIKNNCLKVRPLTIVMWDESYKFYLIKQGSVICSMYQPKNSVLSKASSCIFEFTEICLLYHFV